MLEKFKILALIPARGGSKGIKDKNIINLAGKHLIGYTIEAAKKSKYIDNVVVTTDSSKIAEVSKKYGASVPFIRPAELAADTSKTIDAVLHAKEELKRQGEEYDVLILLQATSPLRTVEDLDGAIETFYNSHFQSVVSVSEVRDNPLLIRSIDAEGRLEKILDVSSTCRRQDMPKYYKVNGSIYINMMEEISENTSFNDNVIPYVIESSHAVDIDSFEDLVVAEYMFSVNMQ